MLETNDSNKISDYIIKMIYNDFSFWFSKAKDYGYQANEIYVTKENAITVAIPTPILSYDGKYMLLLFGFTKVRSVTPIKMKILVKELDRMFAPDNPIRRYILFKHFFIIADRFTIEMLPKLPRCTFIGVIGTEQIFKVYQIIAKFIKEFVKTFKEEAKYGDFKLCCDLENFAEKMWRRSYELMEKIDY